jgi:hypothetical protein
MKLVATTAEIQKPASTLSVGHVSTRMIPAPNKTPFVIK